MKEICVICDKEGYLATFHGFRIHDRCAPAPWRTARDKHDEFMAKVARRRRRAR